MMIRQHLGRLLIALLLLPIATSCRQSPSESASRDPVAAAESPQIEAIATFLPIYWFTQAVAGDKAKVEILIPPGTEVHEYQAKPTDVQAIASVDILVKNGLGLEEFLEKTIENASNPDLKVVNASEGIQTVEDASEMVAPVESRGTHEHHDEHHEKEGGHHHELGNPHVWLDPVLAKQQVANIRDGFIAADPQNKAIYEANAAAYIQKLEQLDAKFKQRLQQYPNCTFITFHNAYPYLATRYNLKQVAVVDIPESSLSPQEVQTTIEAVNKYEAKAIFGEIGADNKLLNRLSKDLNLTLYPIDSMESGSLDPEHYFTAMNANLQTIEMACK